MNKKEIDRLIQNIWWDCYHKTMEACIKEWNIDLKGKDSHLMYPPMPRYPDTQSEVIKAIHDEKK